MCYIGRFAGVVAPLFAEHVGSHGNGSPSRPKHVHGTGPRTFAINSGHTRGGTCYKILTCFWSDYHS